MLAGAGPSAAVVGSSSESDVSGALAVWAGAALRIELAASTPAAGESRVASLADPVSITDATPAAPSSTLPEPVAAIEKGATVAPAAAYATSIAPLTADAILSALPPITAPAAPAVGLTLPAALGSRQDAPRPRARVAADAVAAVEPARSRPEAEPAAGRPPPPKAARSGDAPAGQGERTGRAQPSPPDFETTMMRLSAWVAPAAPMVGLGPGDVDWRERVFEPN